MKARSLTGKTVDRIVQTRFWNPQVGQFNITLDPIVFTDGTRLILHAAETDTEAYVVAQIVKNGVVL